MKTVSAIKQIITHQRLKTKLIFIVLVVSGEVKDYDLRKISSDLLQTCISYLLELCMLHTREMTESHNTEPQMATCKFNNTQHTSNKKINTCTLHCCDPEGLCVVREPNKKTTSLLPSPACLQLIYLGV